MLPVYPPACELKPESEHRGRRLFAGRPYRRQIHDPLRRRRGFHACVSGLVRLRRSRPAQGRNLIGLMPWDGGTATAPVPAAHAQGAYSRRLMRKGMRQPHQHYDLVLDRRLDDRQGRSIRPAPDSPSEIKAGVRSRYPCTLSRSFVATTDPTDLLAPTGTAKQPWASGVHFDTHSGRYFGTTTLPTISPGHDHTRPARVQISIHAHLRQTTTLSPT